MLRCRSHVQEKALVGPYPLGIPYHLPIKWILQHLRNRDNQGLHDECIKQYMHDLLQQKCQVRRHRETQAQQIEAKVR